MNGRLVVNVYIELKTQNSGVDILFIILLVDFLHNTSNFDFNYSMCLSSIYSGHL